MHPRMLILVPLLACTCLAAQTVPAPAPAAVQESVKPDGRKNQKVELIRHEDEATIIEEVRYAGQTQSIKVQPKAGMPEYEIQPTDMARSRPADHRDGMSNATGQRVWNILKF